MNIYHVIKTASPEMLDCSNKILEDYWVLTPPEKSKVISCEDEKHCGELYAIEYDITKDLTACRLLDIMHNRLSIEEVCEICRDNDWVEKLYLFYIQNPMFKRGTKDKEPAIAGQVNSMYDLTSIIMLANMLTKQ